ncbi:MAG TPA: hypothetical protein PKE52_13635, partial [Bacteroidales bacterium]|nr:hypothetical protein [Bacteroidales bacterium]
MFSNTMIFFYFKPPLSTSYMRIYTSEDQALNHLIVKSINIILLFSNTYFSALFSTLSLLLTDYLTTNYQV